MAARSSRIYPAPIDAEQCGVSTGTRVGQRDQVALAVPGGIVAYLEVMGTGDDQMAAARRLRDRDSRVEPRQMVFPSCCADRNAGAGRPPCQRMRWPVTRGSTAVPAMPRASEAARAV